MSLNVAIVIQRTDITTKSGGDLIQFLQLKQFLETKGHYIHLLHWKPQIDLQGCDVVHLVNDRPLILADSLRIIDKMKLRPQIVISPIHHSDDEMVNLRTNGFHQSVLESIFSKFLSVKSLSKPILHWINILADFRMISTSNSLRVALCTFSRNFSKVYSKQTLGRFVIDKNSLQFLANGEVESFLRDYQISHSNRISKYVIPNGKPNLKFIPGSSTKAIENPIIVIGRIEPRKRNLELAILAHELEIPITFLGAFAYKSSRYAMEFQKVAAESKYVTYLGEKSHEESNDVLRNSRVLLNGSFAEVLSLVELEAAAQGKWIVSSGVGYSREYVSATQYKTFPENDLKEGLVIASQLAELQPIQSNLTKIPNWSEVASEYDCMYQEIILDGLKK